MLPILTTIIVLTSAKGQAAKLLVFREMLNLPTHFAAPMKNVAGRHRSRNNKNFYGTLHNVNFCWSLVFTLSTNNALSADFRCKEVYMYCFKVFTLASKYIAHANTHKELDLIKNSYTQQTCNGLKERVAAKLDGYQSTGIETKKRTHGLAETTGGQRVKTKLDIVDNATVNSSHALNFPSFISINYLLSKEASIPVNATIPLFGVTDPVVTDGCCGIIAQPLNPNSIGASIGYPIESSLDESYSAPIFWALTYPSYHVAEDPLL